MWVSIIVCVGPLTYTMGACKPFWAISIPLFTLRGLKDASSFTLDEWIDLSSKSIHSHVATLESHPIGQGAEHAYGSWSTLQIRA